MKTTWRVLDKEGNIVFIGEHGWYNEADEYIKQHPNDELTLDPEMK